MMHLKRSYWEWESQGDSGEAKYEQRNELLRWWGWANYENLTVIWTDFNWIDWMERKYYGWIILFAINVRHMSAFCVVIVVTLVTTSTNPTCAQIDAVLNINRLLFFYSLCRLYFHVYYKYLLLLRSSYINSVKWKISNKTTEEAVSTIKKNSVKIIRKRESKSTHADVLM